MSRTAVIILAIGVGLLFVTALFPPWVIFTKGPSGGTELPYGYTFLFTTPEPDSPLVSIRIDFFTLFLEWLGVIALTGLAYFLEWRRFRRK